MEVIKVLNVNYALKIGTRMLAADGKKISPRGMETLEVPYPVTTVYTNPTERVLFCKYRDANPFFHLMESLWLLAGRKDVEFVAQFNAGMRNYSDDGVTYHGAYGDRLMNCELNQLEIAIRKLKGDKDTRQAVLQIWDFRKDLGSLSKDIPCNDIIFLKVRDNKLNITVCCRSNDMIWGAYGSNVVMFSMLQEYIAARVGVEVGIYYQVSDSFHAYTDNPQWSLLKENMGSPVYNPYLLTVEPYPLVEEPATFLHELELFMGKHHHQLMWDNRFFPDVAIPVWNVWLTHKNTKDGWKLLHTIQASDWQLACSQWLERRGDYDKLV